MDKIREAAFRCLPLGLTPEWVLHFVDHLQAQVEVLRVFDSMRVKLLIEEEDVAIVTRVKHNFVNMLVVRVLGADQGILGQE